MVIAGLVSVVFRRLNQPVVLGYLIAGYIVGPHSPPFSLVSNTEVIREFADFGIVLLMFGLGLEFSIDRLQKVGLVALIAGSIEISIMLMLGYLLGRAFGWGSLEAVFLGTALSISSTAIIVKVLQEMGRMDEESSRVIFGILVVEDFFAVAMMTILSGIGTTGEVHLVDISQLVLRLVLFTVVSFALGLRLFPKFVDMVAKMRSKEVLTVLTIGAAFAMALFADRLGLSIAAGAFIIGAITAESRSAQEVRQISEPIRDIFGAMFFVAMGMLIDLQALRQYVVPAILIALVFVLGKMTVCYIGVFLAGVNKRTAFQVGSGMTPVGEFSLVIAKIGYETGATGAFLQPMMAVVTGVTAVITPHLIRNSDRIGAALERNTPAFVRRRSADLEFWARRVRAIVTEEHPAAHRARQSMLVVGLNILIIGMLLLGAEIAIRFVEDRAIPTVFRGQRIALFIGGGATLLAVAPVVAIWRGLRGFLEATVERVCQQTSLGVLRQRRIVNALPVATATWVTVIIVLEALPLFIRLMSFAQPAFLLPFLLVAIIIAWLAWDSLEQVHKRVEGFLTLRDTRPGLERVAQETPTVEPPPDR